MKNQLSSYSPFLFDFGQPFDGTVIRIPLRTEAQARRSAIHDQDTTISDVQLAMEGFASEIQHGGMLFLKNVLKVSLFIDHNHLASTQVENKSEVVE